jgi:hypothetical protein
VATINSNRELVEAPPLAPRRYGLFNAASAVLDMPTRVIASGLQFYADHCGDDTAPYEMSCGVDNPVKPFVEGSDMVGTDPFWLVARKRCGAVGRTAEEIRGAARAQLDSAEQRAVEAEIWDGTGVSAGVLNLANSGATVIVPAAPGAGAAISALENAYYNMSGYTGVIHVNMTAEGALQYAGMLQPSAGVLRTPVGTAVSLGAGYGTAGPSGLAAPVGFTWAYITGAVSVWRSTDGQVPQPDPRRVMDRTLNQWDVVSERVYAVAWACPEVFATLIPLAAPATAQTPDTPGPVTPGLVDETVTEEI